MTEGSVLASASGGVPPYYYLTSTNPTTGANPVNNLASGNYTVKVTDSKGCFRTTTILVDTFPAAHIVARGDTILCLGSPVKLYVTGANTYTWSPSATLSCSNCPAPMANPSAATAYTVVGTDINHCKDTDQVVITVLYKQPVDVGPPKEICEGESIDLSANGGVAYAWYPADHLNNGISSNPVAKPTQTTNYMVVIKENDCFSDTLYQHVLVEPYPTVNVGPDIKVLSGASVYLKADTTHAVSISWSPRTGLMCYECDNPVAKVEGKITYIAEARNRLGCKTTDDITITVGCDASTFFMPNTFTPNGDGLNDIYSPRGRGIQEINYFKLFNRWGELLFEAKSFPCNDPKYGWNGMYQSELMKADVYVYILEGTCEDGQKIFLKGDVTLYR